MSLRKVHINRSRFRFRKVRKPYNRKFLIPMRVRYRTPMIIKRYSLMVRWR